MLLIYSLSTFQVYVKIHGHSQPASKLATVAVSTKVSGCTVATFDASDSSRSSLTLSLFTGG